MFQCVLVVNAVQYLITKDGIQNWKEITASLDRKDYDGVIRAFASKFEFVNDAYTLLHNEWQQKQLKASAIVIISRRNNSWTYNEKFRCALDFTSMDDDGHVFSISAKDESTENIIKANKSQTYDISVDGIKDVLPLKYDRLIMRDSITYIPYKDYSNDNNTDEYYFFESWSGNGVSIVGNVPLIILNEEINKENIVKPDSVFDTLDNEKRLSPILEILSNNTGISTIVDGEESQILNIKNEIKFSAEALKNEEMVSIYPSSIGLDIIRENPDGQYEYYSLGNISVGKKIDIDKTHTWNNVKKGTKFYIRMSGSTQGPGTNSYIFLKVYNFKLFSFAFNTRLDPVNIDVIKPKLLLNALLSNMAGNNSLVGSIDDANTYSLKNCMIMAAESIRGIKEAKIHTSFSKFADWMKSVFGFIYVINGNTVTFVHRSKVFSDKIVKEIGDNFSDFKLTVNSNIIYSGIKVGYDKQDYDSINGRDEFRFTNSFNTGVNLTDNILELISPYRADAYGIEFLTQKRGEDTTDNSSDNDVFFIQVGYSSGSYYIPERLLYTITGVLDPSTMFNAGYSPRRMLLANKSMIAACTLNAEFTASEGNSDVTINGISEKAPLVLTEADRIFTSEEISIETPDTEFPTDWNGQVTISRNDATYYGYISSTKSNMAIEQSSNYKLIVAKTVLK